MIEFYPQIKGVHIGSVIGSGALFFLRGVAMLGKSNLGMAAPIRYLSYTIDTVLLTSALMLATLLHQFPFVHGWLTAKVLLLLVYIVAGSFALKRGKSYRVRAACFAFAFLTYGVIISIALAHHPLGVFRMAVQAAI